MASIRELITKVDLKTVNHSVLKASGTITVGGRFLIKTIIMEGKNGPWANLPSRKDKEGKYNDEVFFVTAEDRKEFNAIVLEAYNLLVSKPTTPAKPIGDMPF